ncbi:MAG: SDR family oxidoreductase [Burkholderiales bacterium]|nr:SDR family oxidoreductase [Burkholderiales bacterium]MCW5603469.1 SDR family oxidoreductase [Burkholderiales bacterium]
MAPSASRILVTGAGGFVGRALCAALQQEKLAGVAALRRAPSGIGLTEEITVGNIGPDTDWHDALQGITCVVHLAARTHVLDDRSPDPLAEYQRINVAATGNLARQAARSGVRRFVFLSSVKVNGESTTSRPFSERDTPRPEDAYGISKREAEDVLRAIGSETGMEVVVLRPPLVYGPGVKGNFLQLLKAVARNVPLPLASINNRRSLVYVGNLVDAIIACIRTPAAAGKTFLVSDGEDLSTPEMIRRLATAMDRSPRLLPCPPALLALAARLFGREAAFQRLSGSLAVDSSLLRETLGWQPRYSTNQGFSATVQWYYRNAK